MKSFIRFSVLIFILLFAIAAYPAERKFPCADSKVVMKKNFVDGYAYVATAIADGGFVVQLYMNVNNGDWRITGIDNKGMGCNLIQGSEWTFLKISQQM